jgi:hypothetical protein
MDLTKAILPSSVEVGGSFYKVQTGHSFWFRFSQIVDAEKAYLTDFDFLYLDDKPEDRQEGVNALSRFYYEPKELPRSSGADDGERVLDYSIDSDLLYAAILQCYGIDLYEKQYHWHKVRAMIAGLHNTKLNDIIGYRCAMPGKNKELAKAKEAWRLPEKLTEVDKERMQSFAEQFSAAQF